VPAVTLDAVCTLNPCLPKDAQGAALLTAAVEWCEQHCGRKFDAATVTDERGRTMRDDAAGEVRHYLYLARPPVSTVTSLYLDDALLDVSTYEIVSDGGRAERLYLKTDENVPGYATRVSYDGGWVPGAAPAGLVMAVATLMGRMRDRLEHGAVSSESSGGESAGYLGVGPMYDEIRAMLRPFKLMRL
jgi:hypothetical protein